MSIPKISHLEYLVINIIGLDERSGTYVREALIKENWSKTPASFYQLMKRMEVSKLIEGRYESKIIKKQTITIRKYKITQLGQDEWINTLGFYRQ